MAIAAPKYSLPDSARKQLDHMVDKIIASPGDLIDPKVIREQQERLDVSSLRSKLPEGMSDEDFIGILKLALLTECATESYATTIQDCAKLNGADWLGRFNKQVWAPDELTHHTPYKFIMMNLGFSESELDREIKDTQEKHYVHHGGSTPIHMTTFAMIQEYLTDSWHGLVSKMLRGASPDAANAIMKIKRRETLHCVWYRDMTAIQVEACPELVYQIAEQVNQFKMPGASLVPDLQAEGVRWQNLMGCDFEYVFRDMFRMVQDALSDVRLTGELVMKLASDKGIELGPVSVGQLNAALSRLGKPGYGIVGEAALERVGLAYMFKKSVSPEASTGLYHRIRSMVRSWIAEQLPPPAQVVMRI